MRVHRERRRRAIPDRTRHVVAARPRLHAGEQGHCRQHQHRQRPRWPAPPAASHPSACSFKRGRALPRDLSQRFVGSRLKFLEPQPLRSWSDRRPAAVEKENGGREGAPASFGAQCGALELCAHPAPSPALTCART